MRSRKSEGEGERERGGVGRKEGGGEAAEEEKEEYLITSPTCNGKRWRERRSELQF